MKTLKILKSKRGVAIENAILFLLVIFMLCALLASITIIANFQFKIDNMVLKNDVDLDQIGEDFIAYLASDKTDFDTFDAFLEDAYDDETKKEKYNRIYGADKKYTYEIIGNMLTVKVKAGDTALLQVITEGDGVTSWRYPAANVQEIDQIGRAFLKYLKDGNSGSSFVPSSDNYTWISSENAIEIHDKESSKTLLYVRAERNDDQIKVASWRYSDPTDEEKDVDDLAEDFLLYIKDGIEEEKLEGYDYDLKAKPFIVKNAKAEVVLYIEVDGDNNIIAWLYSAPETPADT